MNIQKLSFALQNMEKSSNIISNMKRARETENYFQVVKIHTWQYLRLDSEVSEIDYINLLDSSK